ncbi:MAG: peptide deformylase [Phycisphaerae bacterium]|jgi:peptide deformylase
MKLPDLDSLSIVHYPNPVLRKRCARVTEFGPELTAFTDRMLVMMKEGGGVGLAAPQVGVPLRLFVCNPTGEPGDDMVCINPEFVELTGAEEKEEGCLSLPGIGVTMRRATQAVMSVADVDGRPKNVAGEGLLARIWQHESDHLDGRLITDNMSATDEIANRRAVKQLEADYEASRRRGQKSRCASSS